jgi:hypothetical protein
MFGAVRSATDRNDITADGNALQTVGFDYTIANNQLAVYVGGLLQVLDLHYTETSASPGQITFLAGYVPAVGEDITFIDILGGQGPSGAGTTSLEDAWAVGHEVDISGGDPVLLRSTDPTDTLIAGQHISTTKFSVTAAGDVLLATARVPTDGAVGEWRVAPNDDSGEDLLALYVTGAGPHPGMRVDSSGQIEFGSYAGAYPGGTWTGDGALRWSVYTGTLNSSAQTAIVTGITDILGVTFSVESSAGPRILWESSNPQVANGQFALTFSGGTVTVAQTPAGAGNPGSFVDGEAYSLVVFHRG